MLCSTGHYPFFPSGGHKYHCVHCIYPQVGASWHFDNVFTAQDIENKEPHSEMRGKVAKVGSKDTVHGGVEVLE